MLVENNFKDRISEAYSESEKLSQKAELVITIVAGSNEHLDIMNMFRPTLDMIIAKFQEVNEAIETNFPTKTEEAENVKQLLHMLHSSAKMVLQKFKANIFVAESFKESLEIIEDEILQFEEYVNDINNFVLSDQKTIPDDLMDELNEL